MRPLSGFVDLPRSVTSDRPCSGSEAKPSWKHLGVEKFQLITPQRDSRKRTILPIVLFCYEFHGHLYVFIGDIVCVQDFFDIFEFIGSE
jgi:hypothetical protein